MKPIRKGIYRHYEGWLYEVIGTAMYPENLTEFVIYRPFQKKPEGNELIPREFFSGNVPYIWRKVRTFTYLANVKSSKMICNVPLYENNQDGTSCAQACMRTALNYYLGKDLILEELDSLTGRKEGFYTWTHQITVPLYQLGLDVKYYSRNNIRKYLGGEKYIRRKHQENAEQILKTTDLPVMLDTLEKLLQHDLFQRKKLTLKRLEGHIRAGHLTILLVDWNILYHKEGLFEWHFIIPTGYDEKNIFYHEVGPRKPLAYKKVSKEVFELSRNAMATDGDCLVVYGARRTK